ncbi:MULTISPECIES: MFS transporter [unclassified Spirosoma]|uniref:MFS transporter n=1 Tax=unclassified Spirosoma TaxID=2621999 RepID=UPI00095B8A74|nr:MULTISPECIES: MFS transporter [unclassified Spirosoma]MBN8825717.1 MFS transporter [Spirosoma sp.]OJW76590.1 MAG: MFS transporter [Spirosoma sp. 48-14]
MVESPPSITQKPTGFRWELLALLWLAFFLNQADRQIFSVVLPLIRKDLGLTDAELGLIASALVWTYGLLVPIAGFIGDRFSRRNILGFCLLFWSCATLMTGFCSSVLQFIVLRGVATGGGEAFYAPSANALLGETYKESRSFALSIHQTAVYFGIILSGLIAGYIGEQYGWQKAFYLFGSLGVALAFVFFSRIPKDLVKATVEARQPMLAEMGETARIVIRKPTVIMLTLGFGCMVFVNVGYLTWMPSFLVDKFSMSLTDAGFSSLFYHHLGAFLGVLSGAKIADHYAKANPRSRLVVQALGLLLGAPFIYGISMSDTPTFTYIALFLFGIFRGWYDSNIVASLYEVVSPKIRSSAYGLMLACAFLIGSIAPYLLGVLKPTLGLTIGLASLSGVYVLGSLFLWAGAFLFFDRDKEAAL